MDDKVKHRIVGVLVILAVTAIVLPAFISRPNSGIAARIQADFTMPARPPKPINMSRPNDKPPSRLLRQSVSTNNVKNAWVVQLASFNKAGNAHNLAKELRKKGFTAYTRISKESEGGKLYRVLVGPEVKRRQADVLLSRIRKKTKLKGIIVKYHPLS